MHKAKQTIPWFSYALIEESSLFSFMKSLAMDMDTKD